MEHNRLPDEYKMPAEICKVPAEIAKPAPEYPAMTPETKSAPPEFPSERALRGYNRMTDGSRGDAIDRTGAAARTGEEHRECNRRRLLRTVMMPIAATVATVAVVFASFRYDPLGNDYLRAGELRNTQISQVTGTIEKPGNSTPAATPTNTPTPTTGATPTPTPKLINQPEGSIASAVPKTWTMYHVEGANDETFETTLSEGDPMDEVKAWLKTWGGSTDLMEQNRVRVFLGYEFSEDAIPIGDIDDWDNIYLAQGTIYAVYREDVYYYAFLQSYGPGYFEEAEDEDWPTLPNLEPDFAGTYAWSNYGTEEFVRMVVDGESRYLEIGSVWTARGDTLGEVPGATYDANSNTLKLENCTADRLEINLMGNSFRIEVVGENHIGEVVLWGAGYSGSAMITGTGELYINEEENASVGLMVEAEWGPAALLVDERVDVEIHGTDAAILISGTSIEKAICMRSGMLMTGGVRASGEFLQYTTMVQDENGNYTSVPITLAEISAAEGIQFYDYSVVTPEGDFAKVVRFVGRTD